MYICGYNVLSNGQTWEDFSMISIFAVSFGPNLSKLSGCKLGGIILLFKVIFVKILVFDPPGCSFIGFAPTVIQLLLKI